LVLIAASFERADWLRETAAPSEATDGDRRFIRNYGNVLPNYMSVVVILADTISQTAYEPRE
jgi:hypothetical protein